MKPLNESLDAIEAKLKAETEPPYLFNYVTAREDLAKLLAALRIADEALALVENYKCSEDDWTEEMVEMFDAAREARAKAAEVMA